MGDVAEAVRQVSLGKADENNLGLLRLFNLADANGELTDWGRAFENAWWVYSNQDEAKVVFKAGLLRQPETSALMQVLNGRGAVPVAGVAHHLARHSLSDSEDEQEVRRFLEMLNGFEIVAYSKRHQTVRLTEPVPDDGGEEAPSVRVIEPDRPYSNIQNLREILRSCRDFIWWTEPHFVPKLLEPLAYEADADRIAQIRVLTSAPRADEANLQKRGQEDFKRFKKEMAALGIDAQWRVHGDRPSQHDRFLLERDRAWNVPPINTLLRGDYSEIAETPNRPPFESWWTDAVDLLS
jgi:hypothetical protein